MKNSNNPYDRADSYRVAVTPRKQAIINVEGLEQIDKIPPTVKRWWWCICPGINTTPTQDIEMLKTDVEMDEHIIDLQDLFLKLGTDPKKGFTDSKALEYLARDGPNTLTQPIELPPYIKFCRHLFNGFAAILCLTSILCFLAYGLQIYFFHYVPLDNLFIGFFLLLLILASGAVLHIQENTNSNLLAAFVDLLPQRATVLRSGTKRDISSDELVLGDIVEVRAGNIIPADLRIIDSDALKVDAYNVTGNSEAIVKTHNCHDGSDALQSPNLLHAGTVVMEGAARAVVIASGDKSVLGRMAALSHKIAPLDSPFREELKELVGRISKSAVIMAAAIFAIALTLPGTLGFTWLDAILATVPVLVACLPLGLYLIIGAGLYLIGRRLANRECQVNKLEAIETLGATSTLIVDAVGLLTENESKVSHFWYDNCLWRAEGDDHPKTFLKATEKREISVHAKNETWSVLSRIAVSCNRAQFRGNREESTSQDGDCFGNQVDSALLKYVQDHESDVMAIRETHKLVADISSLPGKNYQISVHYVTKNGGAPGSGRHHVYIKGDPYSVVEACATICIEGRSVGLDDGLKLACLRATRALVECSSSSGSTRVTALADLKLPHHKYACGYPFRAHVTSAEDVGEGVSHNFPLSGFRFVGMVSTMNRVKDGIPRAIDMCKCAGVRVLMVTPESASVAKAMAKDMGIFSESNETIEDIADRLNVTLEKVDPRDADVCVIEGKELKDMTYGDVDEVLRLHSEIVFASTNPAQKLVIVESCQRLGDVVALSGCNPTDAASMKRADVGIALKSGNEVCKRAADIVLTGDDDIFTILHGIEEGRLYYDNLKKALSYITTTNLPELLPIVVYVLISLPMPLGIVTMMCIDLTINVVPAVALFYERAEDDIMKRRPRDLYEGRLGNERLYKKNCGIHGVIQFLAGAFIYFVIMGENGFWPSTLLGQRLSWNAIAVNDLQDSYGQEWTYRDRKNLEYACYSGFFLAILLTQWANLLICRTRTNTIFRHGIRNWLLNFTFIGAAFVALFLVYVPGVNYILGFYPIKFWWVLTAVPYSVLIFGVDEFRKFLMRRNLDGSLWIETYY